MIELGKKQTLTVSRIVPIGAYLAEETGSKKEVLLPKNQISEKLSVGDRIEVFIYKDSEDRPIATCLEPAVNFGEIALLEVKEVTDIGAFLDWNLPKDLFLPFREQTYTVKSGDKVLVSLYTDKSSRLCATMKVYDYLQKDSPYKKDDHISGLLYQIIDSFGAYVAVDYKYSAMIPAKDMHRFLKPGEILSARVVKVLEDGKLELSLREKSYMQLDSDCENVLNILKAAGGYLPYHDKTDPALIKAKFELSKNSFKRAIGHLMKIGKLEILPDGIRLTEK